jgi:4-aminobutyrate aminotransferase/(S)-3-amino-2-methylpropionate transaminase
VTGKAEIMDAPHPGGLGGTYAGSPLGTAAALAVLDVIQDEKLCERSLTLGDTMAKRLKAMQKETNCIGDVRNLGAMVAMELVKNGEANRPDADLTKALVGLAAERGLVLLSCGVRANVIRFLPPITASEAVIHEGLDILRDCLMELISKDKVA